MAKEKIDFTLKAVSRNKQTFRYECRAIIKNLDLKNDSFGLNYSNIELQPANSIDLDAYQLICLERGVSAERMNSSKTFIIKNADCECFYSEYPDSGERYDFVIVQLSKSVRRTFFLTKLQSIYLNSINHGLKFDHYDSLNNDEEIILPKKKEVNKNEEA